MNRDPSEVLLTVGLSLVLAENEKDAAGELIKVVRGSAVPT